ncbi:hypothetical protein GP475_04565 [Corynebacterium poyangense]|uniref:Uncharacterized protein n=1 Tax=Corynebacterium poyangense TaxID=2684405 RepID=A0A7H0SN68_9CORY|nr:hypothetical protein [Corynebacterium poyangense]MBZ8177015.1 hypothetical protein [Corynebacterium poyangense]QNQ89993.1 hypothetical protein GP475_04565 [Corynebacterium poyangense]
MLSWIILIISLALFAMLFIWLMGSVLGRGEPEPPDDPEQVMERNSEAIRECRVADLSFDLAFRGYRADQVDAVIVQLLERVEELERRQQTLQKP